MLRILFLYLSKAKWAHNLITHWGFAWRAASRFVAGEDSEQALTIASLLNSEGYSVALDPLGEHTNTTAAATAAADEIVDLLDKVHQKEIDSYVSIKLTQLGLLFDDALCYSLLEKILIKAKETGLFIRVDMEDSSTTDKAIEITSWMRSIYQNVGIVIQSYLYRSEADVFTVLKELIPIRMVKGAYNEPKVVAYPNKSDVDENFDKLSQIILQRNSEYQNLESSPLNPPILALATHDETRIKNLLDFARKNGFEKQDFEIQMLYGIRRDLQQKYLDLDYPVRIYIPYGTHWYPYFMRRLAERPANVWFFISNFLK
jgi:proline dehydrogenase